VDRTELIERLREFRIAYGQVNGMRGLAEHPALTRVPVQVNGVEGKPEHMCVAAPARFNGQPRRLGACPAYDEHSAAIREEFSEENCKDTLDEQVRILAQQSA